MKSSQQQQKKASLKFKDIWIYLNYLFNDLILVTSQVISSYTNDTDGLKDNLHVDM